MEIKFHPIRTKLRLGFYPPEITLDIRSVEIPSIHRPLRVKWTPSMMQDLENMRISGEITMEELEKLVEEETEHRSLEPPTWEEIRTLIQPMGRRNRFA